MNKLIEVDPLSDSVATNTEKKEKKVLTTDLLTFNMTKKTEFNGCFNQGDFEDLEVHYFEGTESSKLDWSKDWDDTCEKIMREINSIQDFIHQKCRTYFTLVCENNLIKISFYFSMPELGRSKHLKDIYSFEFTITNNGNGEIVVSDLGMNDKGLIEDE
jgi:hypothetical protein